MVYFNMEYNMVINYLFYLRYYIRLSTRLLLHKDFCQQEVDNKELFENLFLSAWPTIVGNNNRKGQHVLFPAIFENLGRQHFVVNMRTSSIRNSVAPETNS